MLANYVVVKSCGYTNVPGNVEKSRAFRRCIYLPFNLNQLANSESSGLLAACQHILIILDV